MEERSVRRLALACLVVPLCLVSVRGQSPRRRRKPSSICCKLQVPDGAFVAASGARVQSLRATSAALRALKYFGGEARDREACAAFVKKCFDKDSGGFTDQPGTGKPDVVLTAVGLAAVVALKLPTEEYVGPALAYLAKHARTFEEVRMAAAGLEAVGKRPPQADDWLKTLAGMRNEDGTFGKGQALPRFTGGAVAAELRLGGKVEHKDAILKALKYGQRHDGGYGKEERRARTWKRPTGRCACFHMLKEVPDVKRLRAFLGRCLRLPRAAATASFLVSRPASRGTYFAGRSCTGSTASDPSFPQRALRGNEVRV